MVLASKSSSLLVSLGLPKTLFLNDRITRKPMAMGMRKTATAPPKTPVPNHDPIQNSVALLAAAPESVAMAVPVEAVPNELMNIRIPPVEAAPTTLPAVIVATRVARLEAFPDVCVMAAMTPMRLFSSF